MGLPLQAREVQPVTQVPNTGNSGYGGISASKISPSSMSRPGVSRSYKLQLQTGSLPTNATSGGTFNWMYLAVDAMNVISGALQMDDILSVTTRNIL